MFDLNEKQKEAVEILNGPILIIAGAGSGKTKALTCRVAYLINSGVEPRNILALTFTNKAAEEMKKRIFKLVGFQNNFASDSLFAGTFHSFCAKILRDEAEKIGYKRNFVIYDGDDQTALVKKIIKELAVDPKRVSPGAILASISRAKSELVGPADFDAAGGGYFQNIAAKIYPVYQDALFAANAFDFDDLIMKVVGLFQENPDILEKYRDIYRYILVDEYQDTNFAQYILVKLLAQKYRNLCVVGDDWQCVYSWRNADFRNILNFEKDYPEAKVVKLEQNYRSTKNILDCAGAVIAENNFRTQKELWTKNSEGAKLKIRAVADEKKEGDFIAKEIGRLMKEEKYSFNDFAVLYRTNAQSRALEESFLKADTPYRIIGGVKFYSRKEIKDILAYLRFIVNSGDLVSLQRIFNVPPRGLGDFSPESADFLKEAEKISPRKFEAAKKFHDFIGKTRALAEKVSVAELIKIIIKETGYVDWLGGGTPQEDSRIENIQELVGVAKNYGNLNGFLEHAALISEADRFDLKKDAVNLMTAHLAKGLEFPVVFIAGMEEGLFPHSKSLFSGSAAELEEERRLCYVGMTRAKENLYLLFARRRLGFSPSMASGFGGGGRRQNIPSRFLANIPEHLAEFIDEGEEYIDF